MVLNFQIEEVLDRLMKNEEAQKLTEAKKSELAKKFMLKWVDKKNTSGKKPNFEVPKVSLQFDGGTLEHLQVPNKFEL